MPTTVLHDLRLVESAYAKSKGQLYKWPTYTDKDIQNH